MKKRVHASTSSEEVSDREVRKPHLEQRRAQKRHKVMSHWEGLVQGGRGLFSPNEGDDSFQKWAAIRQ